MSRSVAGLAFIACVAAIAGGCGSRNPPSGVTLPPSASAPPAQPAVATPPPHAGTLECALIPEPGEPISTVALTEPVNAANAPRPSNESERLLFRQLYETLVAMDCTGRAIAGVASSWRLDTTGRSWLVTLREDAQFADGTPVTAAAVLSAWSLNQAGGELHPAVSRLVESVVPVADRVLAIALRDQRTDAPLPLAHTDLAVARALPGSNWPLGTRSLRIVTDRESAAAASSMMTLVRGTAADDRVGDLASARFLVAPDRDARDLLDEGVDLLLTRDRAAIDYAATLPQYVSVPLPWQRTHVLLTPGRPRSSPMLSEDARRALADDAVRGEARGAEGPFWWQIAACEQAAAEPRAQGAPTTGRIVYDRDDAAARDLAERLVGLAGASSRGGPATLEVLLPGRSARTYQRAVGLSGDALAAARRRGSDAGYILSLDRRPLDPCRERRALLSGVRWLDPDTIVPLVDTRLRAIVRRGRSGVAVEWDGGLIVARAGM